MRSTLAIAAVLLASAAAVAALTDCSWEAPDGSTYDLSALAGTDLSGSDASYNYKMQFCGPAQETTCGTTNSGSFCQYTNANPPVYQHVLTKWDTSAVWSVCPTSTCANGGVQVYFANGDKCGGSGPARAVTYIINCPAAGAPSATSYVVGTQGCIYTFTMTNAAGCAGGGGGGGGDGGSKGLSGGSIFLIFLVVLIPVYIVAGCVWKRTRSGAQGMEACPNIDFWRDLPALVGDGFKFTWRKCLGLCGKGDASYDGMK